MGLFLPAGDQIDDGDEEETSPATATDDNQSRRDRGGFIGLDRAKDRIRSPRFVRGRDIHPSILESQTRRCARTPIVAIGTAVIVVITQGSGGH